MRGLYGEEPALHYSMDGTSPMHVFCKQQNIPAAMFGASSKNANIHSPNEHLAVEAFYNMIRINATMMYEFAHQE